MKRTIVYVDGFNLYFGLKSKGWARYFWLNIGLLAQNLLKQDQLLIMTKYFTSRINSPPDKFKRQQTFIEALETLPDFKIYYGKYQANFVSCNKCGHIIPKPNEKMTDVNIAVEMLSDAFLDKYDTAILISADSDLSAPIRTVRSLFPQKEVVVAFPPDRFSFELTKLASAHFPIGRKKLAMSVFPNIVAKANGYQLHKPASWI